MRPIEEVRQRFYDEITALQASCKHPQTELRWLKIGHDETQVKSCLDCAKVLEILPP